MGFESTFKNLIKKIKSFEDEMKELGYIEVAESMKTVKRVLVRSLIEAEISKVTDEIEKEV